jgi:hypothetical protein
MSIDDFLGNVSSDPDFEKLYNLQLRVIENPSIDLMTNISNLIALSK